MRKATLASSVCLTICAAMGAGAPSAAFAETSDEAAATRVGDRDDDAIIVTARKRVENVQDVSESITVVSGESIDTMQIVQPSDLTRIAPALTFRDNPIPTSSGFAVRGIGTSTFSSTVEQSVSTVVDGVVLGQPQSAASLIDISRVEVLEGPQGLLFGKNASAGLVNIVTNTPRLGALAAEASVTYGSDGELRNTGVLNVPIGDRLAVRLVGFRNRTDGFIHNKFLNEDYNGEKNYGFRGKLLFEPTDKVSLLVSADYAKDTSACCFSTARTLGTNANLANYFNLYGVTPGPDNLDVVAGKPFGTLPGAPLRVYKGISGQLDIDVGELELTSITGYRNNHYILDFDGDQTPLDRFDYNGGDYDYKQFSQELRLASPTGQTIEWLAGLFYFRSTNNVFYQAGGRLLGPAPLPLVVGVIETDFRSKSYAGFGSVTWNASDALRLRVGGRLTRDDLRARRLAYDLPGARPGSSALIGSVAGDTTETGRTTNFSWKVTGEYDVAPDVMVYANAARGYKGPGLASSGIIQPGVDPIIRPEKVWSYDLGIKASFLDNRATFNAALFYEDFTDFQTQIYDTSTNPPGFRTTNAGGLKTKGVQAQFSIRPAVGLTLSANGIYVDAKYHDLDGLSCPYAWTVPTPSNGCRIVAGRPVIDASGNRLANAPKFKFNLAANYQAPVADGVDLLFATDYSWRSDEQFSANGDPLTIQPAFGIWNGSIGLSLDGGKWELRAFVRNLLDKQYVTLLSPNSADTSGGYSQYLSRYSQRQVGLTMRVRLGN
ncbi:iron complex outermembrane recepter protein [Sphingopyxis sp. YR583]|uniref:TonB-dependent receptor n=1 Tax=Sphingopyxis sp. YR583 TaxID=1881047 RepID=UPI0008A74FB8|nr:TonB-dependent receptor [Sphingopyxis sp. YR583]SEH13990.1 iron complex outermembrane recepter protein [Sphingopyxis sp. YR583]